MLINIIYAVLLIGFFLICFKVFSKIHIESLFQKGAIFEIRAFYIIISLVVAHLLSEIVIRLFGGLIPENILLFWF
jgi:uncharacterized membrane protein YwzB